MLFLFVFLGSLLVAIGLGLLSGVSDLRGMTIPNVYPVGIIIAFIFAYLACGLGGNPAPFQSLSSHLITGGVAFVVTFIMTATKTMGGGDSKLITAYSLWMGVMNIAGFLFIMTLAGAMLAIVALFIRRLKPFKNAKEGSWIARAQTGQAVIPYGIPIAVSALFMFYSAHYLSIETLKAFLDGA